jgi:RHS repeat-associated protein
VFEGANLFYVHPDNLDRPVMMTNNNNGQNIAWQARYDPFGNPVTVTSAITNNQRLPGQWFQIEDGLAYNWHRTYDPSLGRYTQADPLGFVDGPSVYGYAGQSPLMRVDPSGRSLTGIAEFCYFFPALCRSPEPQACNAPTDMPTGPLPPLLNVPPLKDLPAFPDAKPVKPKTPFPGGLRPRWKDREGNIYEWDRKKGEVEIYDPRGKNHKGGFDPKTGKQVTKPDPGRTVEK